MAMASNKNNRKRRADKQKARDRRRAESRTEFALNPVLNSAFAAWIPESDFAEEMTADNAIGGIGAVLALVAHGNPRFSATAWTMADLDIFAAFLDDVEANGSEVDLDVADGLQLSAIAWFQFLEETDRWTGTDENLVYCRGVLSTGDMDVPPVRTRSSIELDDVDPDLEREALTALPIVARLQAVLDWVGDGVPAFDDGTLSVDQTRDLAQAIGFDDPPPFESMADFAGVSIPWSVLTEIGLISLDGDRAVPTDRVAPWSEGDLSLHRNALSAYLAGELDDFLSSDIAVDAGFFLVQVLLASLDGDPMPPIEPEDEFDDEQLSLARQFATGLTDRFLAHGWLELIDGLLDVPPPLRPAILAGIPDESLGEIDDL